MADRRQGPFFEASSAELPRWNPGQLLLASFPTLFAELALIRWVAVEVRIFAYFKNLALLLWLRRLRAGLRPGQAESALAISSQSVFGFAAGHPITAAWRPNRAPLAMSGRGGRRSDLGYLVVELVHFLVAAMLAGARFLLIVFVFVPLRTNREPADQCRAQPTARLFLEPAGESGRRAGVFPGKPSQAAAAHLAWRGASRVCTAAEHAPRSASGFEPHHSTGSAFACRQRK